VIPSLRKHVQCALQLDAGRRAVAQSDREHGLPRRSSLAQRASAATRAAHQSAQRAAHCARALREAGSHANRRGAPASHVGSVQGAATLPRARARASSGTRSSASPPGRSASANAASPHAPAKRQMEPLNSGSRGGMPLVAAPQQPGACRCAGSAPAKPPRSRPPVACARASARTGRACCGVA